MNEFDWFVKCPVSRDQRPFYEYLKRKESILLGWVALNQLKYSKRFFITLFIVFIFFLPITFITMSFSYYPIQSLLVNLLLSFFGLVMLYGYFFITWFYVKRRLLEAKVWYEESGWYDGKIWIKPPSILRHERLLCHYQIIPLVNRLKNTLNIILFSILLITLILFFLSY